MLKPEDGFERGRAELRSEVSHLQRMLAKSGYEITRDGYYGPATESVIKEFQEKHSLKITGTVDENTWMAIEKEAFSLTGSNGGEARNHEQQANGEDEEETSKKDRQLTDTGFKDFRGRLEWVHTQEGHSGKPYWPGGRSGITLDPGFDLGCNDKNTTSRYYKDILTAEQLNAAEKVTGLTGRKAKEKLNQSAILLSIRISREQAAEVFPFIASPYWKAICKRIPGLNNPDTPGSVQTALLSLAFNRGYNNPGLEVLKPAIEQAEWYQCANLISRMQQDHSLEGIRKRRQREGKLILDELA